ncbi:MAG: helix-turn-helix transcriptional regulator, partial [Spirochaetia bacterium]|nr:helix-turn-helix transcriptional regulator [Spirochaetia bacterium]
MARTGLKPEALYEKALDAAEDVIRRSGVEHARLTEVARELGISHAALYNHFSTKEALLDAVSKRWLDFVENELGKIACQASPVRERVLDWLTALHK